LQRSSDPPSWILGVGTGKGGEENGGGEGREGKGGGKDGEWKEEG